MVDEILFQDFRNPGIKGQPIQPTRLLHLLLSSDLNMFPFSGVVGGVGVFFSIGDYACSSCCLKCSKFYVFPLFVCLHLMTLAGGGGTWQGWMKQDECTNSMYKHDTWCVCVCARARYDMT